MEIYKMDAECGIGKRNHMFKEFNAFNIRENRNGNQKGMKLCINETSTRNISDLTDTKQKGKRRRRRRKRKGKKTSEETLKPTDECNQVRRKLGRRKPRRRRKRKRKVNAQKDVMYLKISESVSTPPMSNKAMGKIPSSSPLFNDVSQVSTMEYENLPWANLAEPMDLRFIDLEVKGCGVDFDLQARENHLRWLANVAKARE